MTTGGVSANAPPRYGWLGGAQRSGETLAGTLLMGSRVYAPGIGRFLSIDPTPGGNANSYDYCTADPVNCTDLTGNWPDWGADLNVVAVVAEVVATIVPGPIGTAAGFISAGAYLATGNTEKATEMAITATAQLVGAGLAAKAAVKAVQYASKIGRAAGKVLSKVERAAAGATNCFVAGTKILMPDGTTHNIEDTRVGERLPGKEARVAYRMRQQAGEGWSHMAVRRESVYVRRRRVALLTASVVVLVAGAGLNGLLDARGQPTRPPDSSSAVLPSDEAAGASAQQSLAQPEASSTTAPQGPPGAPADTQLSRIRRLTGDFSAKSVVASHGLVFAQNMMYKHTVSVFTADGRLVHTINDSVDLGSLGIAGHPGVSKGAPVELAGSPDGRTVWVSNYSMYGSGFRPEASDDCTSATGTSNSFVYRIDTTTLAITAVVEVGSVPKYVAVTPDGAHVLVTNWCSMDLSVIDTATNRVTATIPTTGLHPRGIAVSPDSRTAYLAVMGSDKVVRVDLMSRGVTDFARTGDGPRHVVLSPDGTRLYVTNNDAGTVTEVDASTGKGLRSVRVGKEPRSMAMSPDGGALYVVNYGSSTVSKICVSDFRVRQTVGVDGLPIGITYEATRQAVWVSSYSGAITIFDDSHLAAT